MLGHYQMSVEEVIEWCHRFFEKIFAPSLTNSMRTLAIIDGRGRYKTKAVVTMLEDLERSVTGGSGQRFLAVDESKSKTWVVS